MKTKHLFVTMALPALAACTAEQFAPEANINNNLEGRKVVGEVTFVAPKTNSRVAWDNGLKWESTDKLGAALMDTPNGSQNADPEQNYGLSDNVFSNYEYKYTDGAFTNGNAVLVEGNYFIYGQHRDQKRNAGLAYSIEANQTTGEDGMAAYLKNQFYLDHIFVKQGDSEVEVAPLSVFPRANMSIAYEGTTYSDLVINKVIVTDATGGFALEGALKPSSKTLSGGYNPIPTVVTISAINNSGVSNNTYNVSSTVDVKEAFDAYKLAKADLGVKYTATITDGEETRNLTVEDLVSPVLGNFFEATTSKSSSVTLNYTTPSKSVYGLMVLPLSETHTVTNLKFEIYTNRGLVTIAGTDVDGLSNGFTLSSDVEEYPNSSTVSGEDKEDKAQRAIKYTGINSAFVTGLTADKTQKVQIDFKDDAVLVPAALTVSSTEELKYYLNNWYKGKKTQLASVAITLTGDDVEIDQEVYNFLIDENNPAVTFSGTLTVAENAPVNTLDKIVETAEGTLNVVNEGTQTWTVAAPGYNSFVNKGDLTIDLTSGSFTQVITNNGTLTVNDAVNSNLTNIEGATLNLNANVAATVENYGTLNVSTSTINTLKNRADLNVTKKIEINSGTESLNRGTITIEKDATFIVNSNVTFNNHNATTGYSKGTIINNGNIEVKGTFSNKGSLNATTNGQIENNGQIACSGQGTFSNTGDINANAGSITLITENEDSEIRIADNTAVVNVGNTNEQGYLTYVVEGDIVVNEIPASANSLEIEGTSVNLDNLYSGNNQNNNIKYIEFKSTSATSVNCSKTTTPAFDEITFAPTATATVTLNTVLTATSKLTVTDKATVTINKVLNFSSETGSNFTNNGTLLIIGKLNFTEISDSESVTLGRCLFSGGSEDTNITWAQE